MKLLLLLLLFINIIYTKFINSIYYLGSNMLEFNFNNYKELIDKDKKDYLKSKFYDRGLDYNPYLLDWFVKSIDSNTNNERLNVDNYINQNLDILLKCSREGALNNKGFFRTRPFLSTHKYKLEYPYVTPISNSIDVNDL